MLVMLDYLAQTPGPIPSDFELPALLAEIRAAQARNYAFNFLRAFSRPCLPHLRLSGTILPRRKACKNALGATIFDAIIFAQE